MTTRLSATTTVKYFLNQLANEGPTFLATSAKYTVLLFINILHKEHYMHTIYSTARTLYMWPCGGQPPEPTVSGQSLHSCKEMLQTLTPRYS